MLGVENPRVSPHHDAEHHGRLGPSLSLLIDDETGHGNVDSVENDCAGHRVHGGRSMDGIVRGFKRHTVSVSVHVVEHK